MAPSKLLKTLLVTFLSFSSVRAGLCKPKSSVSESIQATTTATESSVTSGTVSSGGTISTIVSQTTSATIGQTTDSTTTDLPTTTTFSTIITTSSEASTTTEAPASCSTLGSLPDQRTFTPQSEFELTVETCDGSFEGPSRVIGSGGAGYYPWVLFPNMGDSLVLESDGSLSYITGTYTVVQEPGSNKIVGVSKNDPDRAGWTGLSCQAATTSSNGNRYLECVGDDTNSVVQVCQPSLAELPSLSFSSAVTAGCKQARLIILEQPV
ncbi:hypothetical protein F53441_13807 [Fusarium austroafricanum]|uniref:Ig-like domain-containing protein n=1 Tax=Fusarium austroafricanum TaxID=2364996 RepID=A0A8H4JJX5_9HYPO|nr:hypothetical protein F53441_13807 [Fusarium austroafricanum]